MAGEGGGIHGVEGKKDEEEAEEESLLEGMAVVDFDMLCATVALQTRGFIGAPAELGKGDAEWGGGGVQRMWEGDIIDCFQDRRIAIESTCCPCCTFGSNMKRSGFGPCFLQGGVHLLLSFVALLGYIAFGVTKRHSCLYIAASFTVLVAVYLGYFRRRMRKHFNIKGTDSSMDDFINHLICPCCTLCQETGTLQMNNVRDGVWHGRGDTICIGSNPTVAGHAYELSKSPLMQATKSPEVCSMDRLENHSNIIHS